MSKLLDHPKMAKLPTEIRADGAGRVGLGKAQRGRLFQARMQPDGSILLVPARVVPESEIRLLEDPTRIAALDAAIESAHSGKVTALTLDELDEL